MPIFNPIDTSVFSIGPDGGYFFPSIADRDAFFNEGSNKDLLETGLPITVNEQSVTVSYQWEGPTSPTTYDTDLWTEAPLGVPPGTVFLGRDGASVSSGASALNFREADGSDQVVTSIKYDASGNEIPFWYELPPRFTFATAPFQDQVLSPPHIRQFSSAVDSLTTAFSIMPAEAGTMRVQSYLGTDDTGPVLVDRKFEILPGDVGVVTKLIIPNPVLTISGQQTHVVWSGIDLYGGLQTTGPLIGQTVPLELTDLHLATKKEFLTENNVGLDVGDLFEIVDVGGNTGLPALDGSQLYNLDIPCFANELTAQSTSTQNPSGTDSPLQIEFGPAQGTGSDPVQIDALGEVTFNVAGCYSILVDFAVGRVGAGGSSHIYITDKRNGSYHESVFTLIDNSNSRIPLSFTTLGDFSVGDTLSFEIVRDSIGNDSGGLFSDTPTLGTIPTSPSALIVIDRLLYP